MVFLKKIVNKIDFVDFTAVLIMISGLLNPCFFSLSPNRIVSGTPLFIQDISGRSCFVFFLILGLVILRAEKRLIKILKFFFVWALFYFLLFILGKFGSEEVIKNPSARFSPSYGFWIFFAGVSFFYASYFGREKQFFKKLIFRFVLIFPFFVFLFLGVFSDFALGREFVFNSERFFMEVKTHIFISYGSVLAGCLIGIPLGVYTFKFANQGEKVFYFLNIIQTIPGIAFFGLIMVPLSILSSNLSFLAKAGISGTGTAPAVIVLFGYSLLPIVKNTLEGLKIIDRAVIESGKGMGMGKFDIFWKIEFPLSLPVILNGIRTALVHCVGSTAIAALIGAGGLGVFIFQGIGQGATDLILLGTFPLIIIAIITDKIMEFFTEISKGPEALGK